MYVCTISTHFIVLVVCMYVQESPVCIFYPMVWYIHMVLTAILGGLRDEISGHLTVGVLRGSRAANPAGGVLGGRGVLREAARPGGALVGGA